MMRSLLQQHNYGIWNTFCSHLIQRLMVSDNILSRICVCSNMCVEILYKDYRFCLHDSEKSIFYFIYKSLVFTRMIVGMYL